jgi:hypothetical protein
MLDSGLCLSVERGEVVVQRMVFSKEVRGRLLLLVSVSGLIASPIYADLVVP